MPNRSRAPGLRLSKTNFIEAKSWASWWRKAKGAARRTLRWLTTREALRRAVLPVIMRSPKLQAMVAQTLAAAKQATAPEGAAPGPAVPAALRELPQSAREALEQLRRAYEPNIE